jgi:hypothetical protein
MTFIEHSHVDIEVHELKPDILASIVCFNSAVVFHEKGCHTFVVRNVMSKYLHPPSSNGTGFR